jgi:hypothetical protein
MHWNEKMFRHLERCCMKLLKSTYGFRSETCDFVKNEKAKHKVMKYHGNNEVMMFQGLVVPRSKERKGLWMQFMNELVILVSKELWKICERGIFGMIGLN